MLQVETPLQLLVLKVLEDEGGDGGDDADEEVGAGERDEGRAGDGEGEGRRVHQRDRGEPAKRRKRAPNSKFPSEMIYGVVMGR